MNECKKYKPFTKYYLEQERKAKERAERKHITNWNEPYCKHCGNALRNCVCCEEDEREY